MTPKVVVLSAPSGGGKTTISRALLQRHPERFGYSVSATTRRPRAGERGGEAYHFLSREEFQRRQKAGEFLEWAEYAGQLYGTLQREVDSVLASGKHVILDIEVDGAHQVKRLRPEAITIFVLPTSPRVLIERLLSRKSEPLAEVWKRLDRAKYELRECLDFDRFVRNDDLDQAVKAVTQIVAEGGGSRRAQWELSWIKEYAVGLQEEAQIVFDQLQGERE